jgi:hypothetical protein
MSPHVLPRSKRTRLERIKLWIQRLWYGDPNEDFLCCYCGKVVWGRVLFCSDRCYRLSDWAQRRGAP